MMALTVAIKAIEQSDQCINSKAAFENRFILRLLIRYNLILMESSSSPAQNPFCPKRCLCKSVRWKNNSLKSNKVHTVSERCVLYEVKRSLGSEYEPSNRWAPGKKQAISILKLIQRALGYSSSSNGY